MNIRTGHSRAVKRRMTVDLARMSEKGLEDIRRHLTPVQPKKCALVLATRTLNDKCQSRVTLSLR